jgi:hypothetical protein
MNRTFEPSLMLELLNGGNMLLSSFFLVFLAMYLVREARARKLALSDWMLGRLPPSVNLAVAIFVFDFGTLIRANVIWVWRTFYETADFGTAQALALATGAAFMVVGGLCKIRSVTRITFGDWPWLSAAAVLLAFLSAIIYFH